jgi:putative ABC transport system permease protein
MVVTREYFDITGQQPIPGRSFAGPEAGGQGPAGRADRLRSLAAQIEWGPSRNWKDDPHQTIRSASERHRRDAAWRAFLPSPGAAQEPNYDANGLVQFWIPVTPDPARIKAMQWDIVIRLRDGFTPDQAESELRVLAALEDQTERGFEGFTRKVQLLSDELNATGDRILMPLLGRSDGRASAKIRYE